MSEVEQDRALVKDMVTVAVMTPNQGRKTLGQEIDEEHPELDEYYYQGQKLGTPPPSPFGGKPGEGGPPGLPGMPEEGGQMAPGSEGQPVPEGKIVTKELQDILTAWEQALKTALAPSGDVVDPKPMARGPQGSSLSSVGPARDDKPAGVSGRKRKWI